MKLIEEILTNKGISPTPVRMLVYQCLRASSNPKSLTELEEELESVDKSSISRTLNLLRKHHLVHSFNDGSGSMKYEVCLSADHESDNDTHVHFRCEKCGLTICLASIGVPVVKLPEGYEIHEINYVITGICADCR